MKETVEVFESLGILALIVSVPCLIALAVFALLAKPYRRVLLAVLAVTTPLVGVAGFSMGRYLFLDEPLATAAAEGDLRTVNALLDRGASPDSRGVDGVRPAIVEAACSGASEVVKTLVQRGADVNQRDSEGRTALTRAREGGHSQIVKMLLASGAVE